MRNLQSYSKISIHHKENRAWDLIYELQNNLRLKILGNKKVLAKTQSCKGTQSSVQSPPAETHFWHWCWKNTQKPDIKGLSNFASFLHKIVVRNTFKLLKNFWTLAMSFIKFLKTIRVSRNRISDCRSTEKNNIKWLYLTWLF